MAWSVSVVGVRVSDAVSRELESVDGRPQACDSNLAKAGWCAAIEYRLAVAIQLPWRPVPDIGEGGRGAVGASNPKQQRVATAGAMAQRLERVLSAGDGFGAAGLWLSSADSQSVAAKITLPCLSTGEWQVQCHSEW